MIRTLRGKIIGLTPPLALIETHGIGYGVYLPINDFTKVKIGEEMFLHIYHHHGDDREDLYGFLKPETRNFFEMLLSVSGVGPKGALSIVGAHDLNLLQSAIAENNAAVFRTAPGIGGKTADRIIVDLKTKIGPISGTSVGYEDVYEALLSLGYKGPEINQVLSEIPAEVNDTGERLKIALKALTLRK